MTITLNALQKQRRDTASNWTSNNTVLLDGELGYETDTKKFKIGDGTTAWQSLDYLPIPDTNRLLAGNLTVGGNFTVNGTTTTIDTTTLTVEDKNIEIGKVTTPSDTTADGGGISLLGTTTKTINWVDSTDSWTLSEHLDLANGKVFKINNTEILSATGLGSSVVSSSLTSVGTITTGTWNATAISGSKVTPDFGSQNIVTTGNVTTSKVLIGTTVTNSNDVLIVSDPGDVFMSIRSDAAADNTRQFLDFGTGTGDRSSTNLTGVIKASIHSQSGGTLKSDLIFSTNTGNSISEKLIIKDTGNVGIGGTTSPTGKLTVHNTDDANVNVFEVYNDNGNMSGSFSQSSTGDGTVGVRKNDGTLSVFFRSNGISYINGGNVGIGTTSPSTLLHLQSTAGNTKLKLTQSGSTTDAVNGAIHFGNSTDGQLCEIRGYTSGSNNSGYLQFRTTSSGSDVTAMTIATSGSVGIGTTSPASLIHGMSGDLFLTANSTSADSGQGVYFQSTTNGWTTNNAHAAIFGKRVDASNGYLRFDTRLSGATSEKMRIDSSGQIGMGTSSPVQQSGRGLHIHGTNQARIKLTIPNSGATANDGFDIIQENGLDMHLLNHEDADLKFGTNDEEKMRIDSSGNLLIGRISTGNTGNGHSIRGGDSAIFSRNSTGETVQVSRNNSNGDLIQFRTGDTGNASVCGEIVRTGSTTVGYNTNSDYRLKENEVAISDGITRLKLLKPYRFNFKSEPSKTVDGFYAHEVTPAVPEAIFGEKDDPNRMQGIDQSKLVPLLTAALQEAIAKIEVLETKVAALEAA